MSSVEKYSGKVTPVGNSEDIRLDSETDAPVLLEFLGFLEAQMSAQPERIAAADQEQLARIGKLVKNVNAG